MTESTMHWPTARAGAEGDDVSDLGAQFIAEFGRKPADVLLARWVEHGYFDPSNAEVMRHAAGMAADAVLAPLPAPHPQGGTLRARIEALHRPWYEIDGVRHDMTLPVYGEDVPAGHVCRIDGQDACRPSEEEHWVLACAECRCATDEDVAGYLFWPCPTIALLAAAPAPTAEGDQAGDTDDRMAHWVREAAGLRERLAAVDVALHAPSTPMGRVERALAALAAPAPTEAGDQ